MTKRVLGGDIETNSYEEITKLFDEYMSKTQNKDYQVKLNSEEIEYINMQFLTKIKWVSKSVYDIEALMKLAGNLESDIEVNAKREEIKALFHYLVESENIGINDVFVIKSILTKLSKVIQDIGKDEQEVRDAGFELQAAEQGILPEKLASNLSDDKEDTKKLKPA